MITVEESNLRYAGAALILLIGIYKYVGMMSAGVFNYTSIAADAAAAWAVFEKRLQALQLGGPSALVGALVATVAAAVNGELAAVAGTKFRHFKVAEPLASSQSLSLRPFFRGCAVGFYKLLEAWLPNRSPVQEEKEGKNQYSVDPRFPQVCKIASLLEPELYMAQADFDTGDLVVLGEVPGSASGAAAVVCEMTPLDCRVAVLDPSRSSKVAETPSCTGRGADAAEVAGGTYVKSSDLRLIHRDWRIGRRHIIGGLQSSRMKHLNGLSASVREHRRYGHPCFVPKPESDDQKLRLCVRWEHEGASGALLLEPRFLTPCVERPEEEEDKTLLTAKRRLHLQAAATAAPSKLPEALEALKTQPQTQPQPQPLQATSVAPIEGAIDEVEPRICHVSNVESLTPMPPNCSGTFLGALSWLVGAHTRHVEEEFPTVIRLSSVLAADPQPREQLPGTIQEGLTGRSPMRLSWLLPISETPELGDDPDLIFEPTERLHGISETLEQGDLVLLDRGLQPSRFASCPAVVKGLNSSGCSVAVLDESRSIFIGELHVALSDVVLVHSDWRLGTRVVLGGLQSSHMVHLNGLSAVICPHKRHGHPCFVHKPSSPNTGEWLTLCIRFDEPKKSSMHAVLLEPRFLVADGRARPQAHPGTPRLEGCTPWGPQRDGL
ncbi:unnamed protein product [Durusdinium trenchii]|uniref:Uncharacterized protein n=1 Tax=Durusdinium trenchii TaxID=1381693 RepID=A0ABP0JFV4_9DINO